MNRRNILLFLYSLSAVVFFQDEDLVFIPKIFAGLLVVEYIMGMIGKRNDMKGCIAIWCLLYFSLYAMVSFGFLPYDLPPESILNIVMILVLSISVFNLVDNKASYNAIIIGLTIGLLCGYVLNIFDPLVDEFGRIGRFAGTVGNPNFFALLINFLIAFILYGYDKYTRLQKNLVLIFVVISLYQVVMSGSKMGLLLYLINVLYLVFYIKPVKSAAGIVLITVIIAAISGYMLSNLVSDNSVSFNRVQYLQNVFSGKDAYSESDLMRYSLATKGMDLWSQSPIFGWGYGSFIYLGGFGLYTHNNPIELLSNTGVIGFLLFHISLIQLIVISTRTHVNRRKNIYWAIYFSLIVMVGSFGIVLLSDKLYWLLYFTLLAYMKMESMPLNTAIPKQREVLIKSI